MQGSKRGAELANIPVSARLAVGRGRFPHQPPPVMGNKGLRKQEHKEKLRRLGLFAVAERALRA